MVERNVLRRTNMKLLGWRLCTRAPLYRRKCRYIIIWKLRSSLDVLGWNELATFTTKTCLEDEDENAKPTTTGLSRTRTDTEIARLITTPSPSYHHGRPSHSDSRRRHRQRFPLRHQPSRGSKHQPAQPAPPLCRPRSPSQGPVLQARSETL